MGGQCWTTSGKGRTTGSAATSRHRLAVAAVAIAGFASGAPAVASAASPSPTPRATLPPAPPSGIGPEVVQWLAVSPAYRRTGLVVAQSSQLQCPRNTSCIHLWVSHDGGASWHRPAATGWNAGRATIAVDGSGHEVIYAGISAGLVRSTDGGETWTAAGGPGVPTVLPGYAQDGGVAVASTGNGGDYLLRKGGATTIGGSAGADTDLLFMASPRFPDGGSYSPALLTALDPKTSGAVVLHCTIQLTCNTPTVIPGPGGGTAMTSAGTYLLPSEGYTKDGTVFADTPLGVAKSIDGGVTFTPLNIVSTAGAAATTTPMMALAPGYMEHGGTTTAYVAVFQLFQAGTSAHTSGGVYGTTDGGLTWKGLATTGPFSGGAQAVAIAPDGRLFAGYYDGYGHGGLLCSTDSGHSWQPSCPAVGSGSLAGSGNHAGTAGTPCASCPATTAGTAGVAAGGSGDDPAASNQGSGAVAVGSRGASTGSGDGGRRLLLIGGLLAAVALAAAALVRARVLRRTTKDLPKP